MVEKSKSLDFFSYLILILSVIVVIGPILYTFIAASLNFEQASQFPLPLTLGEHFFNNLSTAWSRGNLGQQMFNSFLMATGITLGKISISILSAFAITYFDFKLRTLSFWLIFFTLMLPIEVRIVPTYEVAADVFSPFRTLFSLFGIEIGWSFSLLNSYAGLIFPLIASATATFLFRQFFLSVPEELTEAAKLDGATPMQFFFKILLPLSKTNIAALVVIIFVYGWNQYLWPLLITTQTKMKTAIVGIQELIPTVDEAPEWNVAMAGSLIVMIPPILVVIFMQKWFIKGLIDHEK